jgi:hypothetical protein
MTAGEATRASGDFADFDRYLSRPQPSKPLAAPALSLARLLLERLHLELAEQLDLFAKTRFGFWRFAKESLQSLADLLRDGLTAGMVNINSVAHKFPDSTRFRAGKLWGPRPPPLAICASARFEQRAWRNDLWLSATCAVSQRRAAVSPVEFAAPPLVPKDVAGEQIRGPQEQLFLNEVRLFSRHEHSFGRYRKGDSVS